MGKEGTLHVNLYVRAKRASEGEREGNNSFVIDSLAFFATFSRTNRIYNRGVTVVFVKNNSWVDLIKKETAKNVEETLNDEQKFSRAERTFSRYLSKERKKTRLRKSDTDKWEDQVGEREGREGN